MYVRTGEGLGRVPLPDGDIGGTFAAHDGLGKQALNEVDGAISGAKRQMQMHYDGYVKYASAAGKGDNGIKAAKERAQILGMVGRARLPGEAESGVRTADRCAPELHELSGDQGRPRHRQVGERQPLAAERHASEIFTS